MQKINTFNKLISAQRLISQCKYSQPPSKRDVIAMKSFTKTADAGVVPLKQSLDPNQYGPKKIDQF